jgi:REP element-mobilizing transposase RayT
VSNGPWNDWYHVVSHVYGSWLRGDPRGYREVNHRIDVDGDYRHPPPKGKYDRLYRRSLSLMKRDPVSIAADLRQFVANAVAEKLESLEIEVLVVSVDAKHLHLLGRFPDRAPRVWAGRAKKHVSHLLRETGLRTQEGGLWARRTHAEPIRDRAHQLNTFGYILRHRAKGAAVWRFDRAKTNHPH